MSRLSQLILAKLILWGTAYAQPVVPPEINHKGAYSWYFGNSNQFIRFNRVTAKAEAKSGKISPFSTGASATVSDPGTGDLFFYTDGQQIFDVTHRVMPGGSGLNGSLSGNQSVIVCPVPGQIKKYFVFTNSATSSAAGEVQVTVVDMGSFGNEISVAGSIKPSPPLGAVESSKKNLPVLAGVSEAMLIVPHSNGSDFWLITQKPDLTNQPAYQSTLINAGSYTSNTFSTQSVALALPSRASHFSYHQGLKLIAVAVSNRQSDAFVLTFDDSNGQIRFDDEFLFNSAVPSTGNQAIYDIEWSPDGNYLYFSVHGEDGTIPGELFQYDRKKITTSIARVMPASVTRSLGLQRGPDGFIYHLYREGSVTRVGRIELPNNPAADAKYVPDVFPGADWQATQFPAVPPPGNELAVSFSFFGTCQNNPTIFFPVVSPAADSLVWELGAGEIYRGWSPVFTFESGTPATAKVTAFLNGQKKEASLPVNIQPFQLSINLPSDTTACKSEFPPPRGIATDQNRFSVTAQISGSPTSVIWSNGQTGNILKPDSAGYYYVIASDGSGCAAYQGVTVKEYGLTDRRANLWYFGDKAGIDFTTGEVLDDSQMTAPEGCAVIGDQNGKLIFYTDGENVYNRDHVVIATNIGGSRFSTQSAVIVQVPDDETLYYIFTTEATDTFLSNRNPGDTPYTVYYSVFDLKENNGLGAVVQTRVPLFSKSTERITAESGWLITHEFGNNAFRTYRITAEGIGNPVISTIGSEHPFTEPSSAEGYMKVGARNNLVVPLKNSQGNFLEVFHFLDSLGTVTDYRKVDLNEPDGQVYGVEFSGLKIFASITGSPSKLVEYYIDEDNDDAIVFVQKVTNGAKIGALQIAPDGLIYIAIEGSNSLGSVGPGDEAADPSSFNFNARPLATGTKSLLGLPNYINQFGTGFFEPAIAYNGICLGKPTSFEGTPTDRIDQFTWAFGDGAGSTDQNVEHTYTFSGLFPVSMNLKNRCGLDTTLVEQVRIYDPPVKPPLPVAVLCNGTVTLDAGQPGLLYFWTTGATTQQITTNTEGSYGVLVEDPVSGCRNEAITFVVDNRPDFDLGDDQTLCEGKLGKVLNAGNPNATIQWKLNGVDFSTLPQIQPSTKVPGVFAYSLKVTDPITGCVTEDEVVYTIKQAPIFNVTATDISDCSSTNGSITLNIISPSANTFGYFLNGTGVNESEFSKLPGVDYVFNNLPSGTYSIIVGDEISGCSSSKTAGISVLNSTFSVTASPPVCSPVALDFQSSFTPPFVVRLTDANGVTVSSTVNSLPLRTPLVGPGVYSAEIENAAGCKLTEDNITVVAADSIRGTISSRSCLPRSVEVVVTNPPASLSYAWSGPGTIASPLSSSSNVSPPNAFGTYNYNVKVSAQGFCESEFTVPVFVESGVPQIASTDICSDQVNLIAGPNLPGFNYVWFRGVTSAPSDLTTFYAGGERLNITTADNGVNFLAVGISSLTGCTYPSAPFTAQIIGKLDAKLNSDPACEDGKLVTFKAESNQTGLSYKWFFNGLPISGAQDTIRRRVEGIYKVQISKSTCVSEASIQMVRGPLPVGKLEAIAVICDDPENQDPLTQQVKLDPGEFFSYEWFRNDVPLGITDPVLVADREGIYKVLLKNSFQCVAADKTDVLNDCIPRIVAPNAFRPASALPENTDFSVYTKFITDSFQIFIYSRWGELVFQSSSADFKWNGGYNNDSSRPLPGGTYAWVIQYVSSFRPDDGVQELRGGVLLLR